MKPAVLKLLCLMSLIALLAPRVGIAAPAAAAGAETTVPALPAEAPASPADASADASPPRDLFAHGTDRQFWTAEVFPSLDPQNRMEHTLIRYRVAGEGTRWHAQDPLAGRAAALSTRGSELLVLMSGGGWNLISQSGSRAGNPLPGDLKIIALAGDGEVIWAVGAGSAVPRVATSHSGSTSEPASATNAAATATSPSRAIAPASALYSSGVTSSSAETSSSKPIAASSGGSPAPASAAEKPATPPATFPVIERNLAPPSPATRPHPLGLYLLNRGQWHEQAVLPDSVRADDLQDITMLATDGRLLIALLERGRSDIRVFQFQDGTWSDVPRAIPRPADVAHIQLLDFRSRPILWAAGNIGPGVMLLGEGTAAEKWSGPVALESLPKLSTLPHRALGVALGQIRLVYADGKGRVAEQVYDLHGKPVGPPIEGPASGGPMDVFLINILEIALAVLLLLVMLGTMRKRESLQEALRRREQLGLAPLGPRFAAGVIDGFPMIIALFIVGRGGASSDLIRQRVTSLSPEFIWLCVAFLLYLLHTTIFELIFRATIGKLLFGLRVVALSGERAAAGPVVMRNVMRLFDLLGFPLILVLVSPLHQRVGDIAAGTLVVRPAAPESESGTQRPE